MGNLDNDTSSPFAMMILCPICFSFFVSAITIMEVELPYIAF